MADQTHPKFFPFKGDNLTPHLTPEQKETLRIICDTFLHRVEPNPNEDLPQHVKDFLRRSGSEMGLSKELEEVMRERLSPEDQKDIQFLLGLLHSTPGTFLLSGYASPFTSLPLEDRVKILNAWSTSPFEVKRKAFRSFKTMFCSLFMTSLSEDKNPNWQALRYPGPDPKIAEAPGDLYEFKVEDHSKLPEVLECDVVIVGSGAGGGVVAGELTRSGFKVIVIEKGRYFPERTLSLIEREAFDHMYENGTVVLTEDSGMNVYAGSVFGGGTTINWSASFRTPDFVLQEWSEKYGLKHFTSPEFQKSLDAVCSRLGVHDDQTIHNGQNGIFAKACERLGYQSGVIPRNGEGAHECGWCCFGCKLGKKNGMTRTYLKDAADSGNCRFLTSTYVERIIHKNGKAQGVEATLSNGKKLIINSKITVVSCGSIHSPALLLRSKVPNNFIGKNLRLHPVVCAFGVMDEPVHPFDGCIMSWYSDVVGNLDGQHYGSKLETPAAHPGVYSLALPWNGPEKFKRTSLTYDNSVCGIVICRDRDSGWVKIDEKGNPRLHYPLSDFDRKSMTTGLAAVVKLLVAAGAKEVNLSLEAFETLRPKSTNVDAPEVKEYIKKLENIGIKNFRQPIFSAHQMGSCRLGTDRKTSVLNPRGESWEVKGLYVADASTFPTSSGANPMITTEAIAHSIAQNIIKALSVSKL